ncbi:unnamed protein product [Ostreobium quekettii]|uniref:Armadillo repeat-containing protein 6 n=1 Tax=Ostreobium quekettii TaxID=121088 RepID=A0A8S1JF50_9CHLO|nr:unnamed protein product [Ostreobium quekettii]|eukprot:evm.model.scf_1343.1 EVM.evm.TU.scf_1343.1   scf_1343:23708-28572(+)
MAGNSASLSSITGGGLTSGSQGGDSGDEPWGDREWVREAVDRLGAVTPTNLDALDDVKRQLRGSTRLHFDFTQCGGIKALQGLLAKGNSIIQMKCMVSLEALAANEDVRSSFRETGVVEFILRLIQSSARKPHSKRRHSGGEIIRLLAGCQPRCGTPLNSRCTSDMRRVGGPSVPEAMFQVECLRERPLPLWYHTSNSILPWGTEAVACLVDILMANVGDRIQEAAEHIIKKILHVSQFTAHIIIEKRDIAALVELVTVVNPTAVLGMKVLTFLCIMHPSNEVTFVRTGGLTAMVQAMRADALSGTVCGEMAAWSTAYFGSKSVENAERLLEMGVADVLVEMLQSTDYCSREAAARAMLCTLQSMAQAGSDGRIMFCEANAIPAILGVVQDGGYHSRQQEVLLDLIRIASEFARVEEYRKEMLRAGAPETMNEGLTGCSAAVLDASKKLQKLLMPNRVLRPRQWPSQPMFQPPESWMGDGCGGRLLQSVSLCFRRSESYRIHDADAVAANALAGAPLDLCHWSSQPVEEVPQIRTRNRMEWVEYAWEDSPRGRENLDTIDEHQVSNSGLTDVMRTALYSETSPPTRRGIGRHSLEPRVHQEGFKGPSSASLTGRSTSGSQSDLFASDDFV